ncbi:MAG: 1-acyl-sn-glycerol-3-phosphate acyltransferase [Bdellovibrionaceae bacterium]|nr:1-acyl-sn-glycerol-3-phosphate acyltransferase [Bdellovibrio sp.]
MKPIDVFQLIKTTSIFYMTLIYLMKSYRKGACINQLKQDWALAVLRKFDFQIEVKNRLLNTNHNQIILGNHISFLDILVLLALQPQTVFLSKIEVARWPIIGAGAKRMGTLFVNRGCSQSRAHAKNQIKDIFVKGQKPIHLAGFPSGTTCLTESKPWKKGLFEIAEQSETQVQPFRISYEPLRECAYIDDDNLFLSLAKLFKTPNKKVIFEWGEAFYVNQLETQMLELQRWTARQV